MAFKRRTLVAGIAVTLLSGCAEPPSDGPSADAAAYDGCHADVKGMQASGGSAFLCGGNRMEFNASQSALVVTSADGTMRWEHWRVVLEEGQHIAFGRAAHSADPADGIRLGDLAGGEVGVGQFLGLCGPPGRLGFNAIPTSSGMDYWVHVNVAPAPCSEAR